MECRNWRTEFIQKIQARVRPHPTTPCLLWVGMKSTTRVRYGLINIPWFPRRDLEKRTKWHVHRVAYMAFTGHLDIEGLDCSHLCHTPTCCLMEHLSIEPHHVNNSRRPCNSLGYCIGGHGQYPRCIFN